MDPSHIIQFVMGLATLIVIDPARGIPAYLFATLLFVVVLPTMVGVLISIIGKPPKQLEVGYLVGFWWRWFIAWPVLAILRLVRWIVVNSARSIGRFVRHGIDGPPPAPPPRRRP